MSADINRDMEEKGIVIKTTKDTSILDMVKFREALESGLMDINVFK